jgi:hypothetical protein
MRSILATLAIMTMAACGSAAQTGPKTSNPPLAKEPAPKTDDAPKPVEIDGLTLKVNALDFQMTMTAAPWSGKLDAQQDGSLRLVFMRKDVQAVMLVIPIKAEKETAKSIAESQLKAAQGQNLTASALADEGNGRYAFTADSAAGDPNPTRTYFGVLPHPALKDAFLILVATSDPKDSDAFLKEVRTIADSIGPIK